MSDKKGSSIVVAPPPVETKAHRQDRPTPQKKRRSILAWSFVLCVIVPSVLASLYFAFVAADQYAVETRFAVRGAENVSAPDVLGMFTGVAVSGSTLTDSYIVMDYIHSKEILHQLVGKIDVRKIFNHPDADFISAFRDTDAPNETFIKYWRKMVHLSFDTSSRIMTVEVRAFSPEDALALSQAIHELSEQLVNDLSERGRRDALQSASLEVERMEERNRRSSEALRTFRDKHQDIDPALSAQANLQRLSQLESQLNEARARLSSQRSFMKDDAPPIQFTRSQIAALEQQVEGERAKLGGGTGTPSPTKTLSSSVESYQELLLEQEFAQKALVAAFSSLERARITADQQQRYLGTFVHPRKPEEAIYPQRFLNAVIFCLAAAVLWAISVLIVYAIRDHTT